MDLKSKLFLRAFVAGTGMAAIIFVPAGSVRFWQAWVYILTWLVPAILSSLYFLKHDPQLLERRMQSKEKVGEQRLIMGAFIVVLMGSYMLAGFDHRFGWSDVPLWLTVVADCLVLGGYLLTFWVMKANTFASRTIQVEAGQEVVSTGPYHFVRHPMYSGISAMFLFAPLALGSYWMFPAVVVLVLFLIFRLLNEEKILRRDLAGYAEYCLGTRFRLVPYVW